MDSGETLGLLPARLACGLFGLLVVWLAGSLVTGSA